MMMMKIWFRPKKKIANDFDTRKKREEKNQKNKDEIKRRPTHICND